MAKLSGKKKQNFARNVRFATRLNRPNLEGKDVKLSEKLTA